MICSFYSPVVCDFSALKLENKTEQHRVTEKAKDDVFQFLKQKKVRFV